MKQRNQNRLLDGLLITAILLIVGFFGLRYITQRASTPEAPVRVYKSTQTPEAPAEKPPILAKPPKNYGGDSFTINPDYVPAYERVSPETTERLIYLQCVTVAEYAKAHRLSSEAEAALYTEESSKILTEGMSALDAAKFLREYSGSQYRKQIKKLADEAKAENPEDYETLRLWASLQEFFPRAPNPVRERAYKRLLELYPDDIPALTGLASSIAWDKPEEALDYALRANELDPKGLAGLDMMGYSLQRLGEYDLALAIYKYGDPKGPFQYYNIHAIENGRPHIPPIFDTAPESVPPVDEGLLDTDTPHIESHPFPDRDSGDLFSPPAETREERFQADAEAARRAAEEAQRQFTEAKKQMEAFIKNMDSGEDDMAVFTGRLESYDVSENFSAARVSQAMEILNRHGPTEGLRKLRSTDPALAAELEKKLGSPPRR